MTNKERLLTAVNHEEPDRTPICAWYTPEAEQKMLRQSQRTMAVSVVTGMLLLFVGCGDDETTLAPETKARTSS